jgi:hypothetical protein
MYPCSCFIHLYLPLTFISYLSFNLPYTEILYEDFELYIELCLPNTNTNTLFPLIDVEWFFTLSE